jgi:hypothetical protein
MIADRLQVDLDVVIAQDHARAPDRQLTDAATAKPATDDETLRVAPVLQPHEPANDLGELLRILLDRRLNGAGRLRVPLHENRSQLFLADVLRRAVAERILAGVLQVLPPVVENALECLAAGLVTDEAFLVLDLDVVAVDLDTRQHTGAVRR